MWYKLETPDTSYAKYTYEMITRVKSFLKISDCLIHKYPKYLDSARNLTVYDLHEHSKQAFDLDFVSREYRYIASIILYTICLYNVHILYSCRFVIEQLGSIENFERDYPAFYGSLKTCSPGTV